MKMKIVYNTLNGDIWKTSISIEYEDGSMRKILCRKYSGSYLAILEKQYNDSFKVDELIDNGNLEKLDLLRECPIPIELPDYCEAVVFGFNGYNAYKSTLSTDNNFLFSVKENKWKIINKD